MLEGSTPAITKERLLARVLVRTTLSRFARHASPCGNLWGRLSGAAGTCLCSASPLTCVQAPHALCQAQDARLETSRLNSLEDAAVKIWVHQSV